VSGGTDMGVLAQTKDLRVVLPFRVSSRSRPDIGGPSAGLAYALVLTDMLDRTDDARRTVAATGTIDADGSVGIGRRSAREGRGRRSSSRAWTSLCRS
jgi:PDZ domain-containing secreted protein